MQKSTTQIFAERLRALCETKGSYSKVSRDLDINRQQFARYLNGTTMPRDGLVQRISNYFDVQPFEMFAESELSDHQSTDSSDNTQKRTLMGWMKEIESETITDADLLEGMYMQYKQSFTQPGKVVCMLAKVFRDELGVLCWRRRYSVRIINDLPGVSVVDVSTGVFAKTHGALVLFDRDGVAGDLVFSSFRSSSIFSMATRVKTGVVMTHGRPGNLGPVAGRHVIEHISIEDSLLAWARLQKFCDVADLPNHIQYHFKDNPVEGSGVLSVR